MLEGKESWEYANADTQQHVHGIHIYPARMIPQIAHRLIKSRSKPRDTVLDPFCGSGGVLTEALLLGRNAVGVDVNPLAYIIANVKTTPLEPTKLERLSEDIISKVKNRIIAVREGRYEIAPFYFTNIFHWFKRYIVQDLAVIKECLEDTLDKNKEREFNNFFQVCFSMTVRKCSNIAIRDNPYFIRALTGPKLENHYPDVSTIFEDQVKSATRRAKEFYIRCPRSTHATIHLADARSLPLEDDSVNLVVTSPPYGEESHTMSYTRFAKLSLLWLGMSSSEINSVEKRGLGGSPVIPRPISSEIDRIYNRVAEVNKKRASEMFSYIWNYGKTLSEVRRVLTPRGYCCIVIGDRSVAGIPISNKDITIKLSEKAGLRQEITYQREIPKKVLPRSDYKVELINRESIIVLKKE